MGRVLATRALRPHPDHDSSEFDISAKLTAVGDGAMLIDFVVMGTIDRLMLGQAAIGSRADQLWQTTCFEMFVRAASGTGYWEYNFAPSGDWAIYRFETYREGMMPTLDLHVVRSWTERTSARFAHTALVEVDCSLSGEQLALALSAVIEETDGTKSYWALHHPPSAPDFHHPDCFALTLGAPDAA